MSVLEVQTLSKRYSSTLALDNVSFKVDKGTVFGLLGPNGAGKTTLVKSILNLVNIDGGKALLNGRPAGDEKSRRGVACLPEKFNFFPYYTVENTIQFFGKMRGLSGGELQGETGKALEKLGLTGIKGRKVKGLSKGQLQRTGLASLLIGRSHLFIVDEPFTGLDPIGIKDLKNLIGEFKARGKTVIISSHILSEMEEICDGVAILNKGRLLDFGPTKKLIGGQSLEDYFCNLVAGK